MTESIKLDKASDCGRERRKRAMYKYLQVPIRYSGILKLPSKRAVVVFEQSIATFLCVLCDTLAKFRSLTL